MKQGFLELASIIESSDNAIISKNLEGIIESWNPGAERLYGYSAEDVIGKNISILIPRGQENEMLDILEKIKHGVHVERYETVRARKDGRLVNISLIVSPVKNAKGEVIGASAIAHDITERKRIEEKLQESERFALSTIDALTTHIAVLDENGTIIAVNKAWRDFAASNPPIYQNVCEMVNYLAVCDVVEGEDQPQALAFAQGIRAVMAGEKKEFFLEYPCHSPSDKRWFAGRVTCFSSPGLLRIVVAHENITERKLAEENLRLYREHLEELVKERAFELEEKNRQLIKEIDEKERAEKAIRESEERYRVLVNLTPDIIYRTKEDRTIDFISSAIRQFGYNPEELIGTPFEEIVHPDDRQQVRNILLERRIGDRRIKNLELRLLNKRQGFKDYAPSYTFVELSARGYWDVLDGEIMRSDKHFL